MVKRGMRMADVLLALLLSAGLGLTGCKATVEGREPGMRVPDEYRDLQADLDKRITSGDLADVELVAEGDGVFVIPDFDREGAVFVVDTSGSMRSHTTNLMRREVLERLAAFLFSFPKASQVAVLDARGRMIGMWQASGMETRRGMPRSVIESFIARLSVYAYNTDSSWSEGLARARDLVAKDFNDLDTEIFILGDEYAGRFWDEYETLKEAEAVPVSVVRAHDALLSFDRRVTQSPEHFEIYGRYLAALTGGHFYTFAPPEYRRDWKTVVLTRLVAEHPGEIWEVDLGPAERTKLNRLLGEQFGEERDFLVGDGEIVSSETNRIKLSITEDKLWRGKARCYVERSWIDGSKAVEYRVTLRQVLGSTWEIEAWEKLWEDEVK